MKRLISLNLALILVMSLLVCPIIATASPVYEITVDGVSFSSDADNSGEGWQYSAENALLSLDGYNGSAIKASGDLTVYTENEVIISGTSNTDYSADSCGIVVGGTLRIENNGDLTISGADNGDAKGGEAIVAPQIELTSSYGTSFYVFGGKGSSAIKGNSISIATKQIEICGGEGASAIYFAYSLDIREKTGAVILSGGADKHAITYLNGAGYTIDPDVRATFYDNSSRIVLVSDSAVLYGDIYEDGDINSKDAVLLAQHLAGWSVNLSDKALEAANVMYDDDINTRDAVLLAQFLAGWSVDIGK